MPSPAVIIVGDICIVVGLEHREDLNGKKARVLAHDPIKDVWHVMIDGQPRKSAVRPENLQPPPLSTELVPGAANRRAQRTARMRSVEDATAGATAAADDGSEKKGSSAAAVVKSGAQMVKTHRKLTAAEHEAAIRRLCAPVAGRPPRSKAATTARPLEINPFDPYSSQAGSDDGKVRDSVNTGIRQLTLSVATLAGPMPGLAPRRALLFCLCLLCPWQQLHLYLLIMCTRHVY